MRHQGKESAMRAVISALVLLSSAAMAKAAGAPDAWQARAVIEAYYHAIDAGEYRQAYALWGDEGRASGQKFEAFEKGFTDTAEVAVFTGPAGPVEGAAGSLYVTVPVRIEARLMDGTEQRFAGEYVLSKVNDVPGASAAQLRWHLSSAEIAPVK